MPTVDGANRDCSSLSVLTDGTIAFKSEFTFAVGSLGDLHALAVLAAFGLAIPLSLLFYMDQNVSSAMVNSPVNK